MYAQCDIEGNQYRLMDHIFDNRKDNNMVCIYNQDVTVNGKGYRKKATRGWQLCIEWKDKSTRWERLCDMKESYPVKVAEYTEAAGISDEPTLPWWTTHVLKKDRDSWQQSTKDTTRWHTNLGPRWPRLWRKP